MTEPRIAWVRDPAAARGADVAVWIARDKPPRDRGARRAWRAGRFAGLAEAWLGRPAASRLVHDANGRPQLTEAPEVHLSAADRDGWTLAAIAARPIGVDVEAARPEPPRPTDLFHLDETEWLASLGGDAAEAFARLWVAKEAWAKAFNRPIDAALGERVLGAAVPGVAKASIAGAPVAFHAFADRIAAVVLAP